MVCTDETENMLFLLLLVVKSTRTWTFQFEQNPVSMAQSAIEVERESDVTSPVDFDNDTLKGRPFPWKLGMFAQRDIS